MPKNSKTAQKLSKTDAPKSVNDKLSASVVTPSADIGSMSTYDERYCGALNE